jgi:hypothetical protein
MDKAKMWVAILGGAVTSALAVFPSGSTVWDALTIAAAAITAAGVYLVPNEEKA